VLKTESGLKAVPTYIALGLANNAVDVGFKPSLISLLINAQMFPHT
jgi:hypothetical protein